MEKEEQQNLQFRSYLSAGALSSKALQDRLSLSQTALSRVVQRNRKTLMIAGAARSTRYALREPLSSLGSELPVFEVDPKGNVRPYADIHTLVARQYGWQPKGQTAEVLDYLPYMIQSVRPEGFMGRAFAYRYAHELSLPEKIADWSDRQALVALAQRGEDFGGNLIVGTESVQRYLAQSRLAPPDMIALPQRSASFADLAEKAISGDTPGSSAGGEQPKFTALLNSPEGPERILVKFATRTTDEGRRWSDLLVCEHIANETLCASGVLTAQTEILQTEEWTFLQSSRFDRVGLWGRLPVYSLMSVTSDLTGYCADWIDAAEQLQDEQVFSPAEVETVRSLSDFGSLIGNTDKHLGNLSLMPDETGFILAPVYDMTPMYYRPKPGGVLPQNTLTPGTLSLKTSHENITPVALQFWEAARSDVRITDQFRSVCQKNIMALNSLADGPSLVI